jgi:sulfur carrier protein
MQIFMNDAAVACAEGTTVAELLAQEGIAPVNVAVAVEDTVVPKAQWDKTALTEGARVIVIKAVQGG